MFYFYTPWKRQKTESFLTFSGGIEIDNWTEIVKLFFFLKKGPVSKIFTSNW